MTDNLTPAQRRRCMRRVRTQATDIEEIVAQELRKRGVDFETNVVDLPGRPDIVLRARRTVVFVDGDFWHGYRFTRWAARLAPFWRAKIERNRRRDSTVRRRLRRSGWCVLRVWQHSVRANPSGAVGRLLGRIPLATSTETP